MEKQMKVSELNKERLTIRKTNPVRATVLNLLVDGVTKISKLKATSVCLPIREFIKTKSKMRFLYPSPCNDSSSSE